jgi:nicotinamide mononucleotide (NMN) deamidase PncC
VAGLVTDPGSRRALVAAIHDTNARLVLAVAGGGNAVITDLLDVPGASRTVVEIVVPYSDASLADLLATDPPGTAGAVSRATAEAMAAACLARARRLVPADGPLLGVACTAALVSDRPKRGDHRAHIAIATASADDEVNLDHRLVQLDKGMLDRQGEDRVVADAVLDMIAAASGLPCPMILDRPKP